MADDVRQRIISSIFSRLNAQGHQETYVAHVKIWEDAPDEGGQKPRYIVIASMYGQAARQSIRHSSELAFTQDPATALGSFTSPNKTQTAPSPSVRRGNSVNSEGLKLYKCVLNL